MKQFLILKKALMSKLKSDIRRNKDHLATNERLKELLTTNPKAPVRFKFLFNDATPAAIKAHLCGHWRSVGIMSDEAGIIFNGYTLNELPFINKMWDGSIFTVERKNEPEKLIRDARITLSLMVQPNVFKGYIDRKGDMAKGIGFLHGASCASLLQHKVTEKFPTQFFQMNICRYFTNVLWKLLMRASLKLMKIIASASDSLQKQKDIGSNSTTRSSQK